MAGKNIERAKTITSDSDLKFINKGGYVEPYDHIKVDNFYNMHK